MRLSISRANVGLARSDSGLAPSCHALRDLGFEVIDGEASLNTVLAVRSHLIDCAACRTRYLGDERFVNAFRARLRAESAPAGLHERVATLLREHAPEVAAEHDA